MTSLVQFMIPAALLLPAFADMPGSRAGIAHVAPEEHRVARGLQPGDVPPPLPVLERARQVPPQNQVRIEQRVIIRISPSSPRQREDMPAASPRPASEATLREVEHGDCVRIENIAGVQTTRDDRLLLFMRNRAVLSADLERTCNARAFYSGFYVERSEDGRLCVSRDRLQSRSGASCRIDALHRMVAVQE